LARTLVLTRRRFLKVGALAGGGLIFGFGLPRRGDAAGDTVSSEEVSTELSESRPSAWIRILSDGRIFLTLARSEMGQGVMTTLPTLLAEELEVGLDQIEIEMAPVDAAYINCLLSEQATGNSTSARDAWLGLREAGAVTRELLIAAAASIWGVPESECYARRGRVYHADGVLQLDYAALAATAAGLPIPDLVFLKDPGEWTLIGRRQDRLDTPSKVAGQACYGLDVRLPDMVYASIHRCDVLGSRVQAWRGRAARARPDVLDVLAVRHGIAVVAESTRGALRGRDLLEVDCTPKTNRSADTRRIRARFRNALGGPAALAGMHGDPLGVLAGAITRLEATYETPFQAHACMEPMTCTAHVARDHCEIHVPTQAQGAVMRIVRRLTGLPEERIRVHTTFLGGGFGRRREQDFVTDAVELAMRVGRPVQVVWTREDDLRHDFYHPMTLHRLRAGIDRSGRPVAWVHRIVSPSISSRVRPEAIQDGIDPIVVAGAVDLPYALPNQRVEYRRADTPVPVGFWRGTGSTQNAFVTECFLDEIARAAGRDPLQMRRDLLVGRPRHLRVLNLAAERAGWGGPLTDGHARGIAIAECAGSIVAQVAEVSLQGGRLRVHRVVCALDCGQVINPDTVAAQMEGGIVFGLTAALKGGITVSDGRVEQGNFDDYPLLRFDEMPEVEVHTIASDADPAGVGEAGTPPIAPAVANAVLAATGKPVRTLPIRAS
jgi:isoquinoline 1-oxidoreductase beta subunit